MFFVMVILGIALMFLLDYLKVGFLISIVCVYVFMLVFAVTVDMIRNARYMKLLDEECDPEKFLEITEKKKKKIRKRNVRAKNTFLINEAAGYMVLGDYEKGKELLLACDDSVFQKRSDMATVYTIDMISCHYALGEIEEAEQLYQTKLVQLSAFDKKLQKAIQMLIGERYFFLGEYDTCYDYFMKMEKDKLNKRQYLCVLFHLAEIEEKRNEFDAAKAKYEEIVKQGNKLGVVKEAKDRLAEIENGVSDTVEQE